MIFDIFQKRLSILSPSIPDIRVYIAQSVAQSGCMVSIVSDWS